MKKIARQIFLSTSSISYTSIILSLIFLLLSLPSSHSPSPFLPFISFSLFLSSFLFLPPSIIFPLMKHHNFLRDYFILPPFLSLSPFLSSFSPPFLPLSYSLSLDLTDFHLIFTQKKCFFVRNSYLKFENV